MGQAFKIKRIKITDLVERMISELKSRGVISILIFKSVGRRWF